MSFFQHYRYSQVGLALQEVMDEMVEADMLDVETQNMMLLQFDKVRGGDVECAGRRREYCVECRCDGTRDSRGDAAGGCWGVGLTAVDARCAHGARETAARSVSTVAVARIDLRRCGR